MKFAPPIVVLVLLWSACAIGAEARLDRVLIVQATPQQVIQFIAANRGAIARGNGVEATRLDSERVLLRKKTSKGPLEIVVRETWTAAGYQSVLEEVRRGPLRALWTTVNVTPYDARGTMAVVRIVAYARAEGILVRSHDVAASLGNASRAFEAELGKRFVVSQ